MTSEYIFLNNGKRQCSNYLVSEVCLDDINKNSVKLRLKPYQYDVEIAIAHYGREWKIDDLKKLNHFTLNCAYNKAEDEIEIEVNNGLDEFIFNICALLNIGRIEIDEDVEPSGLFQAMEGFFNIVERVKSITLSLEEFKMLDGFIGKFDLCNPSIDFLSLQLSIKEISESVCDGAHMSEMKSECFKGGEYLLKWD